jgi:hypothetical protein
MRGIGVEHVGMSETTTVSGNLASTSGASEKVARIGYGCNVTHLKSAST